MTYNLGTCFSGLPRHSDCVKPSERKLASTIKSLVVKTDAFVDGE